MPGPFVVSCVETRHSTEERHSEELLWKPRNSHGCHTPVLTRRLYCACSLLVGCPFRVSQSEMEAKAASWNPTESWSSHPVYARYWQHYYQAMAWMRSHHNAYRKAVESYVSSPGYFPPAAFPQGSYAEDGQPLQCFYDQPWASQHAPCASSLSPRCGQHPHSSTREDQAWAAEEEEEDEEMESDSDSDEGVECDLSNMEITEELRQYFAETERHREERRKCTRASACSPSPPCLCSFTFPDLQSSFLTPPLRTDTFPNPIIRLGQIR